VRLWHPFAVLTGTHTLLIFTDPSSRVLNVVAAVSFAVTTACTFRLRNTDDTRK
jgi:hypothetical protein